MPAKYPEFSDELDTDALEILLYQLVKIVARGLSPGAADHLKGILVRTSPYYRKHIGTWGPEVGIAARYEDWNGETD